MSTGNKKLFPLYDVSVAVGTTWKNGGVAEQLNGKCSYWSLK
jgi:hypothetical protein